ncbi:MAG TPA: hypothetical protein V6C52_08960 [Coleofasciculaceae cyanobacterium]|jgi:hypothetical protein
MTHLCYTLEEAAGRLNLSETVLVRLSQYFKVPKAAYEEVGYLSFKGDLVFSDQDIVFFRQVKERLLAGESLDEVKSRIRREADGLAGAPRRDAAPPPRSTGATMPAAGAPHMRGSAQPTASMPEAFPLMGAMREIVDRTPYEKAAEKSFERYKSMHRTGLGRVFENMMKEVGGMANKRSPKPQPKPMRSKVLEPSEESLPGSPPVREDAILPFKSLRQSAALPPEQPERSPVTRPASGLWPRGQGAGADDASWEQMIRQAADQPRNLDNHLKNAASLLRDRALNQARGHSSQGR